MAAEDASQAAQQTGELEALMHRYQQSDADAAAVLVTRLSPQVFQFFLGQARDRSQAEDLLQDFWLRIHKARNTFRCGEPLLPWLYAIARRVRVDQYRRTKRINEHEFQSDELPETATRQFDENKLPTMADLLKTLPVAQRETVLLLKVTGLSLEEVARATGSSVGAVKQKAHRAYEKLRKVLGGGS
ncbi:MAG TPA: RNA polymerase sigma factor [Bryobacteraceae bacterium]